MSIMPHSDPTESRWIALTVGQFCQLLIDDHVGAGEAIMFQVVEDQPVIDDDTFIRVMRVVQIPTGVINSVITNNNATVHKTLAALLEAGLMK
jgi:hypothetical protein